jgi:large subunit ribosomal protein L24
MSVADGKRARSGSLLNVQNTLLGLGIALILALVAALAGPLFVDWGRYRATFEREASQMAGLPVRIGGAIDVRVLPTPTIVLRDVEVGSRAAPVFGAQVARAELALGSLMKGQLRAASLTLEAPDISLGLDASGQIVARNAAPGIDLSSISIDRLAVANGTLALEDATSRTRASLNKLSFTGEMRSLAGAVKGEGMFVSAGRPYKYRLATSRNAEGGLRVHFNLDPADRPLAFETDGLVTLEKGVPHYEGTLSLLRPAGVELAGGKTVASDPWRLSGKVKADTQKALFEQIELQYGPEERVLRLTGTADMKFGSRPDFNGVLTARQIDLDRAMASSDASTRLPLAALRSLTESLGGLGQLPLPVRLGVGIDSITLNGAALQSVRGDFRFDGGVWGIDRLEFRAPGYTQVALSGRIDGGQQNAEFAGDVSLDSADPRALLAWLEGFERARAAIAPFKVRGTVTAGKDRFAIERVRAQSDRKAFEGRLAYTYPRGSQAAKLDAALSANEFDLDGAIAFFNAAFSGTSVSRPGDIALAVDLGRMTYAGVEARSAKANIQLDAGGLRIEKLSIGDFGGAAINASGQIDVSGALPRGAISLSLSAQRPDGIATLLRKLSPASAETLMQYGTRLAPASLEASIKVDPQQSVPAASIGRLSLDGRFGTVRVSLGGEAAGNVDRPGEASLKLTSQIVSDDSTLLAALGLDRWLGQGKRPTSLILGVNGPLNGDLHVDATLAGEGLDSTAKGVLRLALMPWAKFTVSVSAADLRGLRRDPSPLPLAIKTGVELNNGTLSLGELDGKVGATPLHGKLVFDAAGRLSGSISAERLDIAALVATMIGMPPAAKPGAWPTQAFAASPFADLRGQIELNAAQADLLPSVTLRQAHAALKFLPSGISFEDVTGKVGNGTFSAKATFAAGAGGVSARGAVAIANADAGSVIRAGNAAPIAGRLSSQIEFEGTGSTPAALVAALRGNGTVTLERAQIAGLDAKAIDVAIRAVERGTPIATPRITDIAARTMDIGSYSLATATAAIEVAAGRARLGKLALPPQAENLAVSGSLDLVDETLDARFTLRGAQAGEGTNASQKPEITVAMKGPVAAPRRSIDVSPLVGWLTMQAVDREAKRLEAEKREAERRARLNAEIEERLRRSMAPPTAPAENPVAEASPKPQMQQAETPAGRAPPVIESAPLAPIQQ